ncbi:MAG: hypothetical protein HY828_18680 [Actinobacteria bacterium]|nr:hypothetical protein [Actinomycetota bacterium]
MEVLDRFADQILVTPTELAARWAELEQQLAVFALAVAHWSVEPLRRVR